VPPKIPLKSERELLTSPDVFVGFAATVAGRVTDGQLTAALAALVRRHPLLAATLTDYDQFPEASYRWGTCRPITPTWDDRPWQDWLTHQSGLEFDLGHGPLLRVNARAVGGATEITLLGHHLLGDGKAFFYLARDLAAALAGTLDDAVLAPRLIAGPASFPPEGRLRLPSRLVAASLNRVWRRDRRRPSLEDAFTDRADQDEQGEAAGARRQWGRRWAYTQLFQAFRAERAPQLHVHTLSPDATAAVVSRCRAHGVTVTEAVTTAFLAARPGRPDGPDKVGVSADLRPLLTPPPGEGLGNFVGGASAALAYDPDQPFWDNVTTVRQALRAKLGSVRGRCVAPAFIAALEPGLLDAMNFAAFAGLKDKTAARLVKILCGTPPDRGLAISSLGILDPGPGVTALHFVPPLFASADFVVGVATCHGHLEFTLRYSGRAVSTDAVAACLAQVTALLASP
jgi:hypothetical protein